MNPSEEKTVNVFVLCTGRCGSKTFSKACKHIKNFSCGHESNWSLVGEERLEYPENHIEIDNRLSWLLGRLDRRYGNNTFYVHLKRDTLSTAKSYNKRWFGIFSIIKAYSKGILNRTDKSLDNCVDYCVTVNSNIELFLRDKTNKQIIRIEEIKDDFPIFWESIGAEGDLDKALKEFEVQHNKSKRYSVKLFEYIVWRVKYFFNQLFRNVWKKNADK